MASCAICRTTLPEGAERCPSCGAVSGESNRCPHCHAVAGLRQTPRGYVCLACGKPRELKPGSTVVAAAKAPFGWHWPLAALAAVFAVVVPPIFFDGLSAWVAGLIGLGTVGYLAFRAPRTEPTHQHEAQVLRLAEQQQGILTVTDVATKLGIPAAAAEKALTTLVDGSRVTMEVDEDGILRFVFREIRRLQGAPADLGFRVATDEFAELAESVERGQRENER